MAGSQSPSALHTLQVIEPCSRSWDHMRGDSRVRFCSHCQKQVHDLSAMNADEAERLLCQDAGSLCVRFERAADGRPLTLDYEPPQRSSVSWMYPITLAAAICGVVSLAVFGVTSTRTMGVIRCVPRPTTARVPPSNSSGTSPAPTTQDGPLVPATDSE